MTAVIQVLQTKLQEARRFGTTFQSKFYLKLAVNSDRSQILSPGNLSSAPPGKKGGRRSKSRDANSEQVSGSALASAAGGGKRKAEADSPEAVLMDVADADPSASAASIVPTAATPFAAVAVAGNAGEVSNVRFLGRF